MGLYSGKMVANLDLMNTKMGDSMGYPTESIAIDLENPWGDPLGNDLSNRPTTLAIELTC